MKSALFSSVNVGLIATGDGVEQEVSSNSPDNRTRVFVYLIFFIYFMPFMVLSSAGDPQFQRTSRFRHSAPALIIRISRFAFGAVPPSRGGHTGLHLIQRKRRREVAGNFAEMHPNPQPLA